MKQTDHRLAAIMYTDIKGFSKMMEEDEAHTLTALDYHNTLMEKEVTAARGKIIKTIGDAIMADFPTAQDAVKAAAAIQRALSQYNMEHRRTPLMVRIGVHLGDIYFFENDALGEGINIAARLQSIGEPGGICISGEVFNQVSGKLELNIRKIGPVHLKNITREITAYNIKLPAPPGMADPAYEAEDHSSAEEQSHASASWEGDSPRQNQDDMKIEMNEVKDYLVTQVSKLKDSILKEVEMNRGSGRTHSRSHSHSVRRARHGRWEEDDEEEDYRPVKRKVRQEEVESFSAVKFYRRKIEDKLEKASNGFRGHFISFLSVNAALFMINMLTSAGYPWFLFPLGGWGIGLISNWASVYSARKNKQDMDAVGDLSENELQELMKFHRSRNKFNGHLISNAAVFGFLLMVNLITSPGFLWSLIPGAALGAGIAGHWGGFSSRLRKIKKLKLFSGNRPRTVSREVPQTDNPALQKAYQLRASIENSLGDLRKKDKGFAKDLLPQIDQYVDKIGFLSTKQQELEEILAGVPSRELAQDRKVLEKKSAEAGSEFLKKEYVKSIQEIDSQQASLERLQEQGEVLQLRVNSAVNNLQQINLNLTGMRSNSTKEDTALMADFEQKSGELSEYYRDLMDSYRELEEEGL